MMEMIFLTKGEFLQALKDCKRYEKIREIEKNRLKELNYLRYEKIKSPLDYDVVGYKNGEQIRQIKGHSYAASDQIAEQHEKLDRQIEDAKKIIKTLDVKIKNAKDELGKFPPELKLYLTKKYFEGKTFRQTIKECNSNYDEASLYNYIHRQLDKYYTKAPL